MPPLPVVSGDELARALAKVGYKHERTVGSHMILVHANGVTLSVPRHKEWEKDCCGD
jgi:predicted RNA binding protein YcfA (HicA-like mRNA interferase family)